MRFFGRGTALAVLVSLIAGILAGPVRAADEQCRGQKATIVGTAGKDKLQGTNGPDVIVSLAGDDDVQGNGGDDVICLGPGNDVSGGGPGDDTIYGDEDSDRLVGGEGNDTLDVRPAPTNESGYIGDGFQAEPGDDTYIGSGAPRPNGTRLTFHDHPNGVVVDLAQGIVRGAGNDTVVDVSSIDGSEFDDRLIGDDGSLFLSGLGGDDVIHGGDAGEIIVGYLGNDDISGGGGDDELQADVGDQGNDSIDGGAGTDKLRYPGYPPSGLVVDLQEDTATGFGSDTVTGIENVTGSDGDDTLRGDDGPNELDGSGGNDVVEGRGGNDILRGRNVSGDDGDDVLSGVAKADTLDGGNGNDTASFRRATVADLADGTAIGQGEDALVAIEALEGSPERDVLRGDDGANRLLGGDGRDELDGRGGGDVLDGQASVDLCLNGETETACELFEHPASPSGARTIGRGACDAPGAIVGTEGDDVLTGTSGDDVICGLGGDDRIDAKEGDDDVSGGSGNDSLAGAAGDDLLVGAQGNDVAEAGDGNDVSDGGGGDDALTGHAGNDVQTGGAGADSLDGREGFDLCFPGSGDDSVGACERCGNVASNSAIAFSRVGTRKEGLYKVRSNGRGLRRLSKLEVPFEAHFYEPDWAPSGRTIAFDAGVEPSIYTIGADGKGLDRVIRADHGSFTPDWAPDGDHIVFEAESEEETFDLYKVRPDGSGLTTLTTSETGRLHPVYSPDGTRIAMEGHVDGYADRAMAMNEDGTDEYPLTTAMASTTPDWSPTGEWLTFVADPNDSGDVEKGEIYVAHESGFGLTRLTDNDVNDLQPRWSPDGSRIAFTRTVEKRTSIYVMSADGSDVERLTSGSGDDGDPQWSPDGTRIAFVHYGPKSTRELRIMDADGTGERKLVDSGRADDSDPAWQPKPCSAS